MVWFDIKFWRARKRGRIGRMASSLSADERRSCFKLFYFFVIHNI